MMKVENVKWLLFFCILVGCGQSAVSQTKIIDSLVSVLKNSNDNEKKLDAFYKLSDQSIDGDVLYPYIAIAEELCKDSKDKNAKARVMLCRASYYARKNFIDSGLQLIDRFLITSKRKTDPPSLYLNALLLRSKILDRGNRYSQSLVQLYEVLETAESQHDTAIVIQSKTGIGWVLIEMEQYKEALEWLHDAKNTSSNKNYYKNYGALYSNLATAYNGLGNKDSALYYINIAIVNARRNENLLFLATALSMQGKILVDNGLAAKAEAPLHEVLEIRKKLNDPFYVVFDMSNLASYYATNKQPEKGIALCLEGIAIAKKLGLPSQLLMIYKSLAENFKAANNEVEYAKTLEYIISLKDSFNSINSAKMLAELHEANETKKREKTISEQKLNLTNKNYLLFGSALFLVMAAIITWLAFKNYRRRQNLNLQLAVEKEKIIAAQAVKDAGEQERKRIAADLHDNLGAQANAILYSTELLQQESGEKEMLVNDLHHTAKDMLTSLRETLWVLKKTDVTAADIWIRIINFAKQISRHYTQIKINTDGTAPSGLHLNSAKALNIVFIIQEAINNSLRHSGATTIDITSEYTDSDWKLCVMDNGNGFDKKTADEKKENYGLSNMKERAVAASLNIEIESRVNEGTNITLAVTNHTLIQKEY